jgi:hypothetical protein
VMGSAGLYDARSRPLPRPLLAGLAPARAIARLPDSDADALPALAALLARARAQPALRVAGPDGAPVDGVETRLLRTGDVWVAGVQRVSGAGVDGTTEIVLTLPQGHIATDLRLGARIATRGGRLALRLSGQEPVLLALSPRPLPAPMLTAPLPARVGDVAELRLSLAARSPAEASALRIEVTRPDGTTVTAYSGTAILRRAPVTWRLPLAASDPSGLWQVRATDILSGVEARLVLPVAP